MVVYLADTGGGKGKPPTGTHIQPSPLSPMLHPLAGVLGSDAGVIALPLLHGQVVGWEAFSSG